MYEEDVPPCPYVAHCPSEQTCSRRVPRAVTRPIQSCSVVAERAGIDKIETLGRHIEEKISYPKHSRAMEHPPKTKQPVSTDMKPTEENARPQIGEEERSLALNRALSAFVSLL